MGKESLRQTLLRTKKHFCSEDELKRWFDPLTVNYGEHPPGIHVAFPHIFFRDWFISSFQKSFEEASRQTFGSHITFSYKNTVFSPPYYTVNSIEQEKLPPTIESSREENTFHTFITNGKYNLIISILKNFIQQTSQNYLNNTFEKNSQLIVLFGPQATGKTHLMLATHDKLSSSSPNIKNLYITLDELAVKFFKEPIFSFRENLQKYSTVLLDDCQHLTTYPELLGELKVLLDHCNNHKKNLILSGTEHPLTWGLHKEVYSRLEIGLWTELPMPDIDVRLRFVQQLCKEKKYIQPKEHLLIIAQHCRNMRRISGVIQRIITYQTALHRELVEKDILMLIKQTGEDIALSPEIIITLVAELYGFSSTDIIGERRQKELVLARQIAMYLCRELLGYSYSVIGRIFGGKDHTTVIHSIKKIKELQDNNRVTHSIIKELLQKCHNSLRQKLA